MYMLYQELWIDIGSTRRHELISGSPWGIDWCALWTGVDFKRRYGLVLYRRTGLTK